MMKLNLYSVSDDYISYLRQYDNKVYDNKKGERIHKRKYLGVVLNINNFNYYVPMSSPKKTDYINQKNKIIRDDTKTIIRIRKGNRLYGTLRISNMIPVPISELEPYIVSEETNLKYKDLILEELRFINKNSSKIIKSANLVYYQKNKKMNIAYIDNTVDFGLLENKLKDWINREMY